MYCAAVSRRPHLLAGIYVLFCQLPFLSILSFFYAERRLLRSFSCIYTGFNGFIDMCVFRRYSGPGMPRSEKAKNRKFSNELKQATGMRGNLIKTVRKEKRKITFSAIKNIIFIVKIYV